MYFLSMNPPCTLDIFPDKKLANPLQVLLVNHQDPVGELFCKGNHVAAKASLPWATVDIILLPRCKQRQSQWTLQQMN